MLCCGFVLLILAGAAGWWRRVRGQRAPTAAVACGRECHRGSSSRPILRRLPAVAVLAALLAVAALAAHHLGHDLDRAPDNQRSLLAELMAQPICTGAAKYVELARREEPATSSVP